MARKPKEVADEAVKAAKLTKKKFLDLINEADRQKELAAEYGGAHGTLVRNGIERLSLDRNAFAFSRRINKMEPVKGQACAAALIKYLGFVGVFDQADAFSDITVELRSLLDDLEGRQAPPAPASGRVLDDLTSSTVQ
jgi:hypothetical protein